MSIRLRRPVRRDAVAAVLVVVLTATATVVPAAAAPPPTYSPPVDAPVSDPFRPPSTPYGPGNRGIEYDTAPGVEVRAAADGRVTFAGPVAGTRHVTVLHPDGLRTTVSGLAEVAVVVGQAVRRGDVLGATVGRLHFGARSGDAYLDPQALFGDLLPQVWLVPFDVPPGIGIGSERSAISQLLGLGSSVADLTGAAAALPGDAADWFGDNGGELLRTTREYLPQFVPLLGQLRNVGAAAEVLRAAWEEATRPCTADAVPVSPPAGRRAAVLVAGLGSTDGHAAVDDVDTATLGYARSDVVRFSYAGGRTPRSPGRPAGVGARSYRAGDTQRDLRASARHLADLIEQVAIATPGAPVDLVAHSQGGLVARLALIELERRGKAAVVGLLATVATPHGGADLATAVAALGTTGVGELGLVLVDGLVGLDAAAPSARQLAEGSDVVRQLAGTPLPEGVEAVSVAGRADPIAPVPRTRFAGARSVVIPDNDLRSHSDLPGDARTTRELALALAGLPPRCRGPFDALLDQAVGEGLSQIEDGLGGAAWLGAGLLDARVGPAAEGATALVDAVERR